MIRNSIKTGISFGLTSAIITTLGLMVGLNSSTHSQAIVLGGILMIAIADALSDSLGIHISEESKKTAGSDTDVWEATGATFGAKLLFALTFAIPVLLLELELAMIVSVAWGLLALAVLSYYIAKTNKENPAYVIGEHILIAVVVIAATYMIGDWIATNFQ